MGVARHMVLLTKLGKIDSGFPESYGAVCI